MKSLLLFLLLTAAAAGYAQQAEIPRKEFTLSLSDDRITVGRGQNKKVDITLLKSKAYQKSKVKMGLSSSLPTGLALAFDAADGNTDVVHATITVLADAIPGSYSIILNATINYKTKGSILQVTVE